ASSRAASASATRSGSASSLRWRSSWECRAGEERRTTIGGVRFPVVLFDLDGTVVDSGGIILASMRHATRTVLGRQIPDEALMAAVGGPGLEAQMREFGGDEHLEELVSVYRAHNEPLHDRLELCLGMDDLLLQLKDEGRRLGLVSAKRRSTVELAFA